MWATWAPASAAGVPFYEYLIQQFSHYTYIGFVSNVSTHTFSSSKSGLSPIKTQVTSAPVTSEISSAAATYHILRKMVSLHLSYMKLQPIHKSW